jgi:hypothetical protein
MIGAGSAAAAELASSDQLTIDWDLYLWGTSLSGTDTAGDPIEASFGDIVDVLDMAFISAITFRKGNWSVLTDVIYMDLGDTIFTTANLVGNPIDASANVDVESWVINVIGSYAVVNGDNARVEFLLGARYLDMTNDLIFNIGNMSLPFSSSGHTWDGFLGLKGKAGLSEHWYFSYYLDGGAGDSDFTWQALAGFGYQFSKVDLTFGYRYLDWDFADGKAGGGTFQDLDLSGAYLGVKFKF